MSLKICFICAEYPPSLHGGIGTFTQVLARALAQAGHQVRVVGVYHPSDCAPDYEEDQGVRIWRLREPAGRLGWVFGRRQLFRTVSDWSRRGEIDLIEVPDWDGWAAGWPRLPVPVIVRLNGSASYFAAEMGQSPRRTTFWLERASLRRADFWCSVSHYTANKTQSLYGLRSGPRAILYNSVESFADRGESVRSKDQVVFTGTLTAKKGIVQLIKAWPRVLEVCEGAELHLFGKIGSSAQGQSMKAQLLSQISVGAGKSVHFHGHQTREALFQALRQARLAVFPSYAEAFALAPLEAMALGCPTIYSRRGSGPELIEHERDGLLVEPDHIEEIATAIIRILTDDHLAQRLGEAGRERVQENFSVRAQLARNESFYRGCIDDFKRASKLAASYLSAARVIRTSASDGKS